MRTRFGTNPKLLVNLEEFITRDYPRYGEFMQIRILIWEWYVVKLILLISLIISNINFAVWKFFGPVRTYLSLILATHILTVFQSKFNIIQRTSFYCQLLLLTFQWQWKTRTFYCYLRASIISRSFITSN